MSEIGKLWITIVAKTEEFQKGIDGVQKKMNTFGDTMIGAGTRLTAGITLPIVATAAAFGKLANEAAGHQGQMNEVFTLLPGMSEKAMGEMSQDVLEFSKTMGIIPQEAVPALYQAISAGVPANNVFDFMEIAAKAAIGGVTSLEVAVDGITTVINSYGSDVMTATKASDLMFTAVKLGKTTFEELSASLFQVLPSASALGVGFEEVTAAMATMTAQGVPTSVATTQMRQLLVELSKAGGTTAKTFESLAGKSFKQFVDEGGSVAEALAILQTHADNTGVGLNDLFTSVEAGNAALALGGENAFKYIKNLNDMNRAAGATEKAFQTMEQGVGRQMEKLKAEFAAAKIEIGDKFLPVITSTLIPILKETLIPALKNLADWVKEAADKFNELSPKAKSLRLAFVALAAGIGPALVAIGAIAKGLAAVMGVVSATISGLGYLGRAFRLVAGFIKMKLSAVVLLQKAMLLMSGPVGWIALAVIAIATIGTAWYLAATESERAIKKLTEESNAQFMQMSNNIKRNVIEKVEGVIAEYARMRDNGIAIFRSMGEAQVILNAETFNALSTQTESHKAEKLAFLEQQMNEELALISEGLASGIIANKESAEELREVVRSKYNEKKGIVESGFAAIKGIMQTAFNEQRALTQKELDTIEGIHEDMYDALIKSLQQHVVDYKGIEALKYLDIKNMSAKELKAYRDLVTGEHAIMKTDLENNVSETLTILDELYAAGIISAEEYTTARAGLNQDLIAGNIEIAESEKQMVGAILNELDRLKRDGIMKQTVFKDDTVRVWKSMNSILVGNSIVPDMVNAIIRWFGKLDGLSGTMRATGANIISSLWQGLQSKWAGLKTWLDSVAKAIKDALNTSGVGTTTSTNQVAPGWQYGQSLGVSTTATTTKKADPKSTTGTSKPVVSTWAGMFDTGGIVPGPRGAPQLALVHGGETILPTHKGGSGASMDNTIRHEIDLINVPATVDKQSLEAGLTEMLNSPQVKRRLDRISYENTVNARGLGI